jgi:hypothetical protein
MLAESVASVKTVGRSRVNPFVYFRPIDQQTSSRPATIRISQVDDVEDMDSYSGASSCPNRVRRISSGRSVEDIVCLDSSEANGIGLAY